MILFFDCHRIISDDVLIWGWRMNNQKLKGRKKACKNPKYEYISMIPDKYMREAALECNRYGVWLWRFLPSFELFEFSNIDVRVTKDNVKRIFNILKTLSENQCLNIRFIYREEKYIELFRIYAGTFQREKIFKLVKEAVRKKCDFEELTMPLQEVYKMHRTLTDEDMEHQIVYRDEGVLKSFTMKNLDNSYFSFGLKRVKGIFDTQLLRTEDKHMDINYNYRYRPSEMMTKKLKKINEALDKEFEWQAEEFDKMCAKYRHDPNDEDSDMFVRLAKVRDAYEIGGSHDA